MIITIARHQMLSLRRRKTLGVLLATFVAITALAGVIGWSSQQTITRVYGQAVLLLAETGQPAPPNPVGLKPTLSLLSNLAIYIPLVGALLALVLGHLSLADDKAGGVGRLLFSRDVSRTAYVAGRALGGAAALGLALTASLAVSLVSLVVANGSLPSPAETGRLVVFFTLSLLYLLLFLLIGMATVLLTRRRSLALLSAMGVWLVLTFAVPQFTSGLRPTASLNPVNDLVSTSTAFFDVTARARPFSVSEQYKSASIAILQTAPAGSPAGGPAGTLPLLGLTAGLGLLTARLVRHHDYSTSLTDE